MNFGIIAHSGVSEKFRKTDPNESSLATTIQCVQEGFRVLKAGHSAVDAVEIAINVMESSGYTNSGKGAVVQADGNQRMDASIMDSKWNAGMIASLRGFENPISVARMLFQDPHDHIFYAHDFVTEMAKKRGGFKMLPLSTPLQLNTKSSNDGETVGAVAIDLDGLLCAGTSTGGREQCQPGRIGDSCVLGAGTYCNQAAAVSNTGWGEWIIKLGVAKRVIDLIYDQKFSPQAAIDRVDRDFQRITPHTLGTICIDRNCKWGIGIAGASMNWAAIIQENDKNPILYYGCAKGDILTRQI
jgi:beta-aspartyl-peptidase (threonine type)